MKPFDALIKEFAETTGLPLQVAGNDSCNLEYEDIIITMQYRHASDDIVIFAPVLTTDEYETLPNGVLFRALELSYNEEGTRGAFLGMFEGALVLSVSLSMNWLDAAQLCARVLTFAETAQDIALELETILSMGEDHSPKRASMTKISSGQTSHSKCDAITFANSPCIPW